MNQNENAPTAHGTVVRILSEILDSGKCCSELEQAASDTGFDFRDLAQLAGFLTQIRNTPVRQDIPWTFAAMQLCGVGLALFRDYTPTFAAGRAEGFETPLGRTTALTGFLLNWLDRHAPEQSLVHDVLIHETTVRELRTSGCNDRPTASVSSTEGAITEFAVPALSDHVRLHQMDYDPIAFANAYLIEGSGILNPKYALDGSVNLEHLERRPRIFLWRRIDSPLTDTTGQMTVETLELDPQAGFLLNKLDGRRTIDDIAAEISDESSRYDLRKSLVDFYASTTRHGLTIVKPCQG